MVEDQAPRCRAFERSTGEDQPKPHCLYCKAANGVQPNLFAFEIIEDGFSDNEPDLIALIVFYNGLTVGIKAL